MDTASARPRLSPALVWSWVLLTLDTPSYWLWDRWLLHRSLTLDGAAADEAYELFIWGTRAHFVLNLVLWTALLVGMWVTARARGSSILRQATALYAAQMLTDALTYGALVSELVAHDSLWLDYSPLVSLVMAMSGGAFFVLYIYREGGRGLAVLLPLLAHVGMLAGLAFSHLSDTIPDNFTYVSLALSLFYWLSWLAIPRELLSLDDAAPPARAEPHEASSRV